ncbi:hypothetical protein DPMN_135073 [Dreissena polymorpha]|uniref:Uncharacterized protein n=1 Tax=Dreissena polymorpha TaxID=45954 RepID=A0A9D4JEC1_DREPO|nr:hypothetical protein DPMN_135073 [Dreissena polymorpha]
MRTGVLVIVRAGGHAGMQPGGRADGKAGGWSGGSKPVIAGMLRTKEDKVMNGIDFRVSIKDVCYISFVVMQT